MLRNAMHPTIEENCYESEATQLSNLSVEDVQTQTQDDTPPDGGYGWICVAACFSIKASIASRGGSRLLRRIP